LWRRREQAMYLLYLDESGGAAEQDQQYYVLGGISAFERKPYFIGKDMDDLQAELFPKATDLIEFHSSAIRNGNGEPWESMSRGDRMSILNRVYDLLAKTQDNVSLFAVAMHKPSFPADDPIQRTCEEMAGHFDAYLARLETGAEKQRGLMIFDQCNHQATLHALLAEYRTTGASWGRVRHLAEIPMFTDSRLTRMLQLADFVAYAVFRRYQSGDSKFLDKILKRFDQSGGRLHGLVHLVARHEECFCPACVTRR
jgi:Protein of unknown function (DUF3800)